MSRPPLVGLDAVASMAPVLPGTFKHMLLSIPEIF